ncbi:protein Wnt-4a-like [Prinia subflava]|uniref:protein Wnt-4a-like n=1 Tax=Prinia subflava TaxID=208062 RepID=UPI002FE26C1F
MFPHRWLSEQQAVLRDPRGCDGLPGLVEEQAHVCWQQLEAVEAVKEDVELAVLKCQHQLHSHRWNCSTLQGLQLFGEATIQGMQESASIHAISSVVLAVTRACSHGELHQRGCHRKIRGISPEGFQWSGCSDNLSYGTAFSQAFLDSPERSRGVSSGQAPMNLHSNEAARKPGIAGHGLQRAAVLGQGLPPGRAAAVQRCSCELRCSIECEQRRPSWK